jgi:hypothetical protein
MPLKSPEQLLANALVADPAVAAVVGQRVYPVVAPASADLPFITWPTDADRFWMGTGPLWKTT